MGDKRSPQAGQAPATAGTAGRRSWPASRVAAWSLLGLIILLFAVDSPLQSAARYVGQGHGLQFAAGLALLPMVPVGFVVARRQPGNPIGWMFLGLIALLLLGGIGADYAWLSYRLGHHLPLAVVGVVLGPTWICLFVALPLVILLFPDGRLPSPRWRPVLWGYLAVAVCWPVSIYAVTVGAVAAGDIHLVGGGDLRAVDNPAGSSAWLGSVEALILPVLAVFWLVFVASQVLAWRRAGGERRQQLKWLMSGAAVFMAALAVTAVVGTLDVRAGGQPVAVAGGNRVLRPVGSRHGRPAVGGTGAEPGREHLAGMNHVRVVTHDAQVRVIQVRPPGRAAEQPGGDRREGIAGPDGVRGRPAGHRSGFP